MYDNKKELIRDLIQERKIVTLQQIQAHIHNNVRMTIMRKLDELSYFSSYSHSGKYYTLHNIPKFSHQGLWSYNRVGFSKYGTLKETCMQLVSNAQSGFTAKELEEPLKASVRLPLLNLYKENRLYRNLYHGENVYYSLDKKIRQQQIIVRESQSLHKIFTVGKLSTQVITDELKAAIILFYSTLDEKQRRLYAGLESIKIGHGGDQLIAKLLNIHHETVSKGREELVKGNFEKKGVRKQGSGRHNIKKNS